MKVKLWQLLFSDNPVSTTRFPKKVHGYFVDGIIPPGKIVRSDMYPPRYKSVWRVTATT